VNRISAALALDALRRIPEVLDGTFTEFDPEYGSEYNLDAFKRAEAALLSSDETYGTDVQTRGQQLRREMATNQNALKVLAERLSGVTELALDLETFPTIEGFLKRDIGDVRKSAVRLISLSDGQRVWLIDTVACGQNIEPLRSILETTPLTVHNAQFDVPFLVSQFGITPRGGIFDTLIAARVLSNEAPISVYPGQYRRIINELGPDADDVVENPKELVWEPPEDDEEEPQPPKKERVVFIWDWMRISNALDAVLQRFLDIAPSSDESASDWKTERLTDKQLVYAAEDTAHLPALKKAILARKMAFGELVSDERDLEIIRIDLGTLECCLVMHHEGSLVDVEAMEAAYKQRKLDEAAALRRAQPHLPGANLDSPKDSIRALGEAGIYVESMDKRDLAKQQHSPIVRDLMVYRRIRGERIDLEKLLRAVHSDNRIHARYLPAGAGTGRMSSKSPNLQNIRRPPGTADQVLGYINFRKFFIAPAGWQIIKADYNQAELRGTAVVANEPHMLEAYKNDEDLHWKTAAGLTPGFSEMKPEQQAEARSQAKAPNFGLIYSMSARGFRSYAAETYGLQLSKDQAVDMRDDWFALYPRLIRWHEEAREAANNFIKYGETLLGRKRRINPMAERINETWTGFQALTNHVVQGSCADMLKLALIEIHQKLQPDRARLIGCVHDEVLVYARNDAVEATKTLVKEAMENAGVKVFGNEIKFLAEVKSGGNWDL